MSSEKYITTQNDIDLLMRQLVISEEHSKIIMTKHRGDLKKEIVDACKLQDGNEKVLYESFNPMFDFITLVYWFTIEWRFTNDLRKSAILF